MVVAGQANPLTYHASWRRADAIDLDTGLFLEDRGTRLQWDSSPDDLRRFTRPDICAAPGGSLRPLTLAWNDRVFGLRCQVTAAFPPGRDALCGVRLVFEYPEGIRSVLAGFAWLGRQLAAHFGPPLSIREDGEQGKAWWLVNGVTLRHEYFDGMGGGHYLLIFPQVAGPGRCVD
jgi:hypothetical protein